MYSRGFQRYFHIIKFILNTIHYAYSEGSSVLVEGVEIFEASKNHICSDNLISSANKHNVNPSKSIFVGAGTSDITVRYSGALKNCLLTSTEHSLYYYHKIFWIFWWRA